MTDHSSKPWLISIVGPTAVGKTALAIRLAKWLNTEIISADSRQFYREMSLGTAKPSREELDQVKHHFIDSHAISESYNAGQFGRDATALLYELHKRFEAVIAVGGSSLYLKALWEGFDEMPTVPEEIRTSLKRELEEQGIDPLLRELKSLDPTYFEEVDRKNTQRVIRALEVIRSSGKSFSTFRKRKKKEMPYRQLKIGLNCDRELLFSEINERMDRMISQGLFDEVASLYPYRAHNALQTVGYTEIFDFMDGSYDRQEAIRLLKRNSRRYAKRQLTWFRRFEDIHWFEPGQEPAIRELIEESVPRR